MDNPLTDEQTEDSLLDRPVRCTIVLSPHEYRALATRIHAARMRGARSTMRELVRDALHQMYPETAAS